MLIHIVLMEFANPAEAEETERRLKTLPAKIPVIRELAVGRNVVQTDRRPDGRQWTLGLYMKFDSVEDLDVYKATEEHRYASKYAQGTRSESAACDFYV